MESQLQQPVEIVAKWLNEEVQKEPGVVEEEDDYDQRSASRERNEGEFGQAVFDSEQRNQGRTSDDCPNYWELNSMNIKTWSEQKQKTGNFTREYIQSSESRQTEFKFIFHSNIFTKDIFTQKMRHKSIIPSRSRVQVKSRSVIVAEIWEQKT